MIFGIDVSKWQGTIDWPRVSGVNFAICRATIGTVVDPTYARNIKGAKDRGLLGGAYHFLYPSRVVSARAQADKFMATIGNPEGILCVLDVERDGTAQPDENDVAAFVARWRERYPNHPLIIYTGKWYWAGSNYPIDNARGSHFGPLWMSRYVDPISSNMRTLFSQVQPSWWTPGFGGWQTVTILQFSSSASISGISGRCDVNAYRGTISDLRRLAFSGPVIPDTNTEPEVHTYEKILPFGGRFTIPAGVAVRAFEFNVMTGEFGAFKDWTPSDRDSSADFDAYMWTDATRGDPFLRITNGVFAGMYLASAPLRVTENPAPVEPVEDTTPFDQQDINAATAPLEAQVASLTAEVATLEGAVASKDAVIVERDATIVDLNEQLTAAGEFAAKVKAAWAAFKSLVE